MKITLSEKDRAIVVHHIQQGFENIVKELKELNEKSEKILLKVQNIEGKIR